MAVAKQKILITTVNLVRNVKTTKMMTMMRRMMIQAMAWL